jgi:Protein of unknown function (DUF2809)
LAVHRARSCRSSGLKRSLRRRTAHISLNRCPDHVEDPHEAWPTRGMFLALAVATIIVGLLVHKSGALVPDVARDVLGDALWAVMIVWWLGVLLPRLQLRQHGAMAFAICAAVELSQLLHSPALDAARGHPIGHLVLGSDFDARDLVAYAVGVVCAVTALRIVRLWWMQRPRR